MSDLLIITQSFIFFVILTCVIYFIGSTKNLQNYPEFTVGLIGWAFFMYLSWVITYMAHIKPFITPELPIQNK